MNWREDLDGYHKGERAALGKAHGDPDPASRTPA